MAYSPSEKYPGAVDTDPNYQGGKFRDNNPSTTNNGSPLKAIDRNELLARDEAIMNDAGFEYSGVADTPQDSQLFKAYKASLGNGANLLSNHNFLIASPDDSQPPPDATPRSYPPGFQIFSGVFANETTGITNLTYIDGRVSFSGGDFYMSVQNTGAIARLTLDQLVASVADFDGKPRTRGVSFSLIGDSYRVTVGVDALEDLSGSETPLGSVKFEQGSVATKHSVETLSGIYGDPKFTGYISVNAFATIEDAIISSVNTGSWLYLEKNKEYEVSLSSLSPNILIDGNFNMDMNGSSIVCTNDGNNSFPLQILRITSASLTGLSNVNIKNGKFVAPQLYDQISQPFPLFSDLKDNVTGLAWNVGVWYNVADVNMNLTDVEFVGYWGQGLLGSGGSKDNARTSITRTTTRGLDTSSAAFATGMRNVKVTYDECQILGHNNQGTDWSDRGRCLYIHPNIAYNVKSTKFQGSGRTQLNHFSASQTMDNVIDGTNFPPPETCFATNCEFVGSDFTTVQAAVLTTNLGPSLTIVSGCTFDNVLGVEQRCNVKVNNCNAINGGALWKPRSADPRYPEFNVTRIFDCQSEETVLGASTINTEYTSGSSQGQPLSITVKSCVLDGGTISHLDQKNKLIITDSEVNQKNPSQSTRSVITGEFNFVNCRFGGQSSAGFLSTNNLEPKGTLTDCTFDMSAWGAFNLDSNPSSGDSVTINDNSSSVTLTFGTDIQIGSSAEDTARNLVGAINSSSSNMKAESDDGVYVWVYLEFGESPNYGAISSTSSDITVTAMTYSRAIGFNARLGNVSGGNNRFLNFAEITANSASGGRLGVPSHGDIDTIPSDQNLYANANHNFFYVSGSQQVRFLRLSRANGEFVFQGSEVSLRSIDGFSITDTGNISPEGGGTKTIPAGTALRLRLNQSGEWEEM